MDTHNLNITSQQQEYLRLPKVGHLCSVTGLSRSSLNELILPCASNGNNPPVKSIVLKKKHNVRGIRLIVKSSLLDYLGQFMESTIDSEEVDHEQ